ncbi:12768_t:CDS:1 [Ambispora gerdemannii]|uniref:12768_t:CDS:1 n=1 Tax=Ambispora gerdemannii TaxID=144530 RepID=A0A9N9BFN2_9GLOM|nr:12768_t:CDS:1 [Ambispora gerdemannii]
MSNSVVSTNYDYLNYNDLIILSKYLYQLTLSIEELTKPAVKKSGNSDKPPRPQNSWIIFRRDYEAYLRLRSQQVKLKIKETAKECSLKWRKLSSEVKCFFKVLEKIAFENHKSLYPNYKYKPKNEKVANIKKWIFREQKGYAFVSLPTSNSSSFNDTTSTIEYNPTVITASTTIDDTHPFMIHNNIDVTATDDIYESLFDESFNINNHNNVSINNSSPYQFITNNPITPSMSSPLSESQSLSQLFIPEYDLLNFSFENLLYGI